jgi:hypothetical protein
MRFHWLKCQSRFRKSAQDDKWSFSLTAGTVVPSESGDTMSRRPRRNHTPAFKAKVALAARHARWRPLGGAWTVSWRESNRERWRLFEGSGRWLSFARRSVSRAVGSMRG